jgi:hypothetical protein
LTTTIGFQAHLIKQELTSTPISWDMMSNTKDKMGILNMLYDMIGYSINKKKTSNVLFFARTALELKVLWEQNH